MHIHFDEPVSEMKNHLHDSPIAGLKEKKGADKGWKRVLLSRRRMNSTTLYFSLKVTESIIHVACN